MLAGNVLPVGVLTGNALKKKKKCGWYLTPVSRSWALMESFQRHKDLLLSRWEECGCSCIEYIS